MARDATARLYDVDKDSVVLTRREGPVRYAIGTITFAARKGRLVNLDKLHESIWATRLSGGTRMALSWLEVSAVGEVASVFPPLPPRGGAVVEGKVILKVTGSHDRFVLTADPKAKAKGDEKAPFERLRRALERGEKVVSVTGRIEGWSGPFPKFLSQLPAKPRTLLITDFRTSTQNE